MTRTETKKLEEKGMFRDEDLNGKGEKIIYDYEGEICEKQKGIFKDDELIDGVKEIEEEE